MLGFNCMLGLQDQSCEYIKGVVVLNIVSRWFIYKTKCSCFAGFSSDYKINMFSLRFALDSYLIPLFTMSN